MSEITRRNFIKAMGAASAASIFGLAGCNSQRASEAGSSSGSGSEGYADTITFSQGAEPRGLDPAFVDDGESAKIMCNIYETLLRYEDDSCDLLPCLASDYTVSDDGLTYVFTLNEGITFHDGTDFNADAVVANIQRQLEPNRTEDMPYASFVYGSEADGNGVESVEATGDYEVTIHMRSASTPFLKNLAMALAAPIVSPTALDENDGNLNENPVGTGPYQFVSWSRNQNVVLKAYDKYWDSERAAKTPNLIFTFISENASRVTALNNGEADIIDGIDSSVIDTITGAGMEVYQADGMNINYMAFNTIKDPWTNVEARRAVCQAINVEEMVKSLYGDYATVANSVMPLWMAPYDEDIEQVAYDPDAAKETLSSLGITEIKCCTYSNVRPYNTMGGQALAESVQGYLSAVGVNVTIEAYDWTTYRGVVEAADADFDICFYGWNGDNGDPDNFMNLLSDPSPSMNVARYNNEEYRNLIAQGLQAPEGDERDDIYHQCEQMVAEECPWLVISHATTLAAYNPKVSGFIIHPTAVVFMRAAVKEE